MSGFEIAGVILGALPLIISALEGYKELNRKRELFFKRAWHISRMISSLCEQQKLIEGDLQVLLLAAGIDKLDLGTITAGKCQDLLQQPDMVDEIKIFMGSRYTTYLDTLFKCEEILFKVARSIGGFKQGPMVDNGNLKDILMLNPPKGVQDHEFRKRLKFTMRKDDLQRAIAELDGCTLMLSRLRVISTLVHEQSTLCMSQKTVKMVKLAHKVRESAAALHGAISRSWNRQCHTAHHAHLYLSTRLDCFERSAPKRRPDQSAVPEFKVALEGSTGSENKVHFTGTIKTLELEPPLVVDGAIGPSIRFNLPSKPACTAEDLRDICQSITQASQAQKLLRIFLNHDHRLSYEYSDPEPPKATDSCFISLEKLLESPPPELSLKQRLKLALLISSSLLQLYNTAWLFGPRKEWFFFHEDSGSGGAVDLDHPFVSCCFADAAAAGKKSRQPQSNLTILNLGILIIELWHNQTIESFCRRSHRALDDSFDNRQSNARRWLNETEGNFISTVFEAAVRCVECRFDVADIDLDDDQIRKRLVEAVVKPLLENCR